ncbi:transmembrane protein 6/97 [Gilbertella persicaria]|uniref:transmembrane protein 6/97 n=1 Tax=Gilbertella persicaria TaxID=101096 RepID=UPI00221FB83C|nr:transmembrane protein 6/97 [Gilbertella persicaria]KAI8094889.1 transmembrane protein 6/97 [Gilbertella persicaria]
METLLSRPLDLVYFIYFSSHILATCCIDSQAFLPSEWYPQVLKDLLSFYVHTYKDPFMGNPDYWFKSFVVCELVFQLPFFVYACIGLLKNTQHLRFPLAIYGAHVATTVLPLLAEVLLNPEHKLNWTEKVILCGFYGPYFALPCIMLIDSFIRVNTTLKAAYHHHHHQKTL